MTLAQFAVGSTRLDSMMDDIYLEKNGSMKI